MNRHNVSLVNNNGDLRLTSTEKTLPLEALTSGILNFPNRFVRFLRPLIHVTCFQIALIMDVLDSIL